MLIYMQKPDATYVAGYRTWEKEFTRYVKKGEHGIKILAPTPFTVTKEKEKIDPETQRPILDDDGVVVKEPVEVRLARFRVVSVFDVSQTDGKPLPTLAENLTGDVRHYQLFMDALRAVSPLPIVVEQMPEDTDGICHFGDRIAIREGMSEIQTVSAGVHELAHAKMHDLNIQRVADETAKPKDRRTEEVEAESVSYAVCQYYGIETGANSFGYLAVWSRDRDVKELNASLDTIRKTTAEIIDGIDERFRALAKARGIDLSVDVPEKTQNAPAPEIPPSEFAAIPDVPAIVAAYARNAEVSVPRAVGTNVLMTPVFDDMNFNRTGKKIRVTVEEPIGKYQLFSREEHGEKRLYFLTASERIQSTDAFFSSVWDEKQKKRVDYRPTEAEFDAAIIKVAERFERDMANPATWAMYQQAAVLNRLDECEAHNSPIREQRENERESTRLEREARREAELREKEAAFDVKVNEMDAALVCGERVETDPAHFTDKNPLFALFDLYRIDLPMATKGWINRNLKAVQLQDNGRLAAWGPKDMNVSKTFMRSLHQLIMTIKAEQEKQRELDTQSAEPEGLDPVAAEADRFLDATGGVDNDLTVPDPSCSVSQMIEYGYNQDNMYPLSPGRAVELFDTDHTIFLLYPDNTEAMVLDRDEIITFGSEGICGITKADWARSPVFAAQKAVAVSAEGSREAELLHGGAEMFGIYQVKDGEALRNIRFAPVKELETLGLTADRTNYDLVYTGHLVVRDTQTNLHRIYSDFQGESPERPADYTGRSPSVSDVIVLQWRGQVSAHYVDSVGFHELPSFTGNETPREQTGQTYSQLGNTSVQAAPPAPEYTGPSVAELEAQVKTGGQIALTDLARAVHAERQPARQPVHKGRPSLLGRLEANNARAAAQTPGGAPAHTTKNLEV